MKKQILNFSAVILGLFLMAFVNNGNSTTKNEVRYVNFTYSLTPRFEPITKSKLQQAATVADFFEDKHLQPLMNYEYLEVVIVENDKQTDKRVQSNFYKLSKEQHFMLENLDYSNHFIIRAPYHTTNQETGEVEYFVAEPHFTVVPEKQAVYNEGENALIDYLKIENLKNTADIDESKLQFAKLYFTVTKNGLLSNIYLDRTSGYKKIDAAILNLLTNAPGKWTPAQNAQGQNVDQELVITFGAGGC